jgi:hypothetical protein
MAIRRTLDELYWDTHCTHDCGCTSLKEALLAHPELRKARGEQRPEPREEDEDSHAG